MKNRITINEQKPFKDLKCDKGKLFLPVRRVDKLNRKLLDELLDMLLEKMPDARHLMINPRDHKGAKIGKYQYRKLKIKIDEYCPEMTIRIKK